MNIHRLTNESLLEAARRLRSGTLVAFPTETVYGLGADATNDKAVAGIFAAKGRPRFNPLIVHVDGVAMAQRLARWNGAAEALAAAFWPGPLTLVLPRLPDSPVSLLASAGGDTLALRMPAHPHARALIAAAGIPLAAPSANRSGRISPTLASHVAEELGDRVPFILDGGACAVGIESTVIDISGETPVLLRPGSVTREQLEDALEGVAYSLPHRGRVRVGADWQGLSTTSPPPHLPPAGGGIYRSPGQLASHYAPSLPVRLNVTQPHADEALLAFGAHAPQGAKTVINLSAAGDLSEAAATLFAALRALDKPDHAGIAVMPIPMEGLGIAINDRLERAAAR